MNWKLRFKNPTTMCALVSALVVFIYSVAQALGIQVPVSQDQLMNVLAALLTLVMGVGIVVDPTTHGLKDSTQVMGYEEPREELNHA